MPPINQHLKLNTRNIAQKEKYLEEKEIKLNKKEKYQDEKKNIK